MREADRNEEPQTSIPSLLSVERESNDTHEDSHSKSGPEATIPSTSAGEQPSLYLGFDSQYYHHGGNIEKIQDSQGQNEASSHHNEDHQGQDVGIRQGDSYEIALDVLMTLGAGDLDVDTPTLVAPVLGDIEDINVSSSSSILKTIDNLGHVSVHVANQLSLGRTIELLRNYRYKIAPWVSKDSCTYILRNFVNISPNLS